MANLYMALVWLFLGSGLLAWQWLHAENHDLTIRGTGLSLGWLPFLLAVYNLVRWCTSRSLTRRRPLADELRQRHPPGVAEQPRPAETPDPNFNFTDEPPVLGPK